MKKTTYYLWRHEYKTEEEYEKERQKRKQMGYRVVTFIDGPKDKDINEGLKAIIRNHMYDDL